MVRLDKQKLGKFAPNTAFLLCSLHLCAELTAGFVVSWRCLCAGLLLLFKEPVLGSSQHLRSHQQDLQQPNLRAGLESQPGRQLMTPTHHLKMETCTSLVMSSKLDLLVNNFSTKVCVSLQASKTHLRLSHGNSKTVQPYPLETFLYNLIQ